MDPLISICIPTYRQIFLLKENLESICEQTYKNVEVLVSDDTPDDTVMELIQKYVHRLPIKYFHNSPSLGSPANWNFVLKKASGNYVLLLHHDDQFSTPESLASFVTAITKDDSDFAFGRNTGVEKITGNKPLHESYFNRYYKHPELLVTGNLLGVPSNVLLKKDALLGYDPLMKWIVDIEFYTRLFIAKKKFTYIDSILIKQGVHEGQVTNECINDTTIILFENITYASHYIKKITSIKVFDFYWRLLRNNNVRSVADITITGVKLSSIPGFILQIIAVQNKFNLKTLKTGIISRLLMTYTYLFKT